MKVSFKKLVTLFIFIFLFSFPTLAAKVLCLTGASRNEVFAVQDVRWREEKSIQVEIDSDLLQVYESRPRYFEGRVCPIQVWCSFLVRNFLSSSCTFNIERVEFRHQAPPTFERNSLGLFNGGDVYIIDSGNTAVIVCQSISDVNVTQLRYHAMFIFGIPNDFAG